MLFTGDSISAEEAHAAGLISTVVDEDKLEEEILRIADKILQKSPSVIVAGKTFLRAQRKLSRDEAYRAGEIAMVANLTMVDGKEGLKAFLEKRKPNWTKAE